MVLFSCEKEDKDPVQTCKTCDIQDSDKFIRIEVCPETLTYYEDGVYTVTLPHDGEVADFVEAHTYGGFTCY